MPYPMAAARGHKNIHSTASAPVNRISNGTFDTDLTGWHDSSVYPVFHPTPPTYSIWSGDEYHSAPGSFGALPMELVFYPLILTPEATIQVKFWVKGQDGEDFYVTFGDFDSSDNEYEYFTTTPEWVQHIFTFHNIHIASNLCFSCDAYWNARYIDDIEVNEI